MKWSTFKGISGRTAFLILTLIVFIHIIVSYAFIHENRLVLQHAHRDEIIQKIVNTIHLVQATPELNRKHAVDAFADPDVHVSLTKEPLSKLQFTEISLWTISQALRNHLANFSISIKMGHQQWLNLNATVYSHFLSTQIVLISFEIIVFGALLFAAWSINRFSKPLRNFKLAAERLGMDIHAKPLSIYGPTLVRESAEAMNALQQRIQDLIKDRTQMLAAISHDLRTPITRMKLRTQFIEDSKLAEKLSYDLDEMETMISQTLAFAREDSTSEEKVKLDLHSLLALICDDMQDMGHNVTLHCKQQQIPFYGRTIALKRAFTNIINNGIKYGNKVEVSLRQRGNTITVTAQDDGPGIDNSDIAYVMRPFYRGDKSRSKDTGGVGLGLAVTKDIVTDHNGTIRLKNAKQGGLEVTMNFYVVDDMPENS